MGVDGGVACSDRPRRRSRQDGMSSVTAPSADRILPWSGRSTPKAMRQGGHRIAPLDATLERVLPHMQRIGVTRLADVTGLDRLGVPVVMAVRPFSRSVSVHQGKGLSLAAAKASAAMEAAESWHAQHLRLPRIRTSASKLARDHALIDLDRLPVAGEPDVDRQSPIHWICGTDLLSDDRIHVPAQLIHTDFCAPRELTNLPTSSNGLASGNCLCEALCSAIYELIERDCTALLRSQGSARRDALRLDIDTVSDPAAAGILAQFQAAGLITQVWDMTSDIGVPAFSCRIFEYAADNRPVTVASNGFGCHLDPAVALSRALTEAAQARLTVIAGSRDDVGPAFYQSPQDGNERYAMEEIWLQDETRVDFRDLADLSTDTIEGDLQVLLTRLRAADLRQVVWFDLSHADIDLPVVRVIIPGLGRTSRGAFALGRRPGGAVT